MFARFLRNFPWAHQEPPKAPSSSTKPGQASPKRRLQCAHKHIGKMVG